MSPNTLAIRRSLNVADRLSQIAAQLPDAAAVLEPTPQVSEGRRQYRQFSFRQLDEDSSRVALALRQMGVKKGARLALMVRPSFDFISLVFALFKSGAVSVLIDPGMGRKHLLRCLDDVRPEGFVAISLAQAVRVLCGRRYTAARYNVTVGRRWFWKGPTLDDLRNQPVSGKLPPTAPDDPAAIIFTSGSTGPPKGVLYSHANFDAQVDGIRDQYDLLPGGIDLACFPLFGLFNCAMGVTTVIPDMDASRPAQVDPRKIVDAIRDCGVTQSFASPAVWDRVSEYCVDQKIHFNTLRRVFSAGAPVSPTVLARIKSCMPAGGEAFTPYGATEALPISSIPASQVLRETRSASERGAGACVGRRFAGVHWKVIRISDDPIESIEHIDELPAGQIGELIVNARQVTRAYVTRVEANAFAKIAADGDVWHRMGDVGYLDDEDRFWFCGRKSQRVVTATQTMFTEPCEAIFNTHPAVARSALVGVGPLGNQLPVMMIEPKRGAWPRGAAVQQLRGDLLALGQRHETTSSIEQVLFARSFPVDVRHNSKIGREKLALIAARSLTAKGISR
jgi:acyl-CoA synthetase (AMP-forming)/AMP-acid ligase II